MSRAFKEYNKILTWLFYNFFFFTDIGTKSPDVKFLKACTRQEKKLFSGAAQLLSTVIQVERKKKVRVKCIYWDEKRNVSSL